MTLVDSQLRQPVDLRKAIYMKQMLMNKFENVNQIKIGKDTENNVIWLLN